MPHMYKADGGRKAVQSHDAEPAGAAVEDAAAGAQQTIYRMEPKTAAMSDREKSVETA